MGRYLPTNAIGFDSLGDDLPEGFDYYSQAITQGVYGPTTITATGEAGSYIQSISYDLGGNVVAISAWVKQ